MAMMMVLLTVEGESDLTAVNTITDHFDTIPSFGRYSDHKSEQRKNGGQCGKHRDKVGCISKLI